MKKSIWIVIAIVILGGLAYVYMRMYPTQTVSGPNISLSAKTLVLGTSAQFGSYLESSDGMTLYTFNKDTAGVSNCSGPCAVNWPPYTTTNSNLVADADISGVLSTIKRSDDGSMQVTYNGMPLYLWIKDTAPGDITGDGINGFFVAKK